MAINLNLLPLLADLPATGGKVLTLGVQRPLFTDRQMAETLHVPVPEREIVQADVFRALGFDACESLDVSTYEGADYIFDLNEPDPPSHLVAAYDLVMTGGTLEHVFHVSRALQHAASFVRSGGFLVHIGPANNWINHGFYQLCPGLLLDYLDANGWDLYLSALIDVLDAPKGTDHWRVKPGLHRVRHEGKRQQHFCVARRGQGATIDRVPKQRVYRQKHDGDSDRGSKIDFAPYDLMNGTRI